MISKKSVKTYIKLFIDRLIMFILLSCLMAVMVYAVTNLIIDPSDGLESLTWDRALFIGVFFQIMATVKQGLDKILKEDMNRQGE